MKRCCKKNACESGNIHGKDLTIHDFTIPEFLEWLSHRDINEYIICEEIEDTESDDNLNEATYDNNIGVVFIGVDNGMHTLLPNIDVVIQNESFTQTQTTDERGLAKFDNILFGHYNILINDNIIDGIDVNNEINIQIVTFILEDNSQGDTDEEMQD